MSLYSAYKDSSKAKAEQKSGEIGLESYNWRSQIIDKEFAQKKEILSDTVGTITDTLSLADTLYGEYESAQSDIEAIEKQTGEKAEGNWFKQMFGIGSTKFGDTEVKNRKLGFEGAKAKTQNMFQEWESGQISGIMKDYEMDEPGAKKYLYGDGNNFSGSNNASSSESISPYISRPDEDEDNNTAYNIFTGKGSVLGTN